MTSYQPPPPETILPEDSSSVKGWRFSRWLVWAVWAYFTFVVIMLTMAFFLLLFNANPDAGFVAWVFRSADRAMEPFRGIFPTATAGNGSIIDFSVLFAIIVYGIIALLIHALVNFIDRKIAEERAKALYIAQEEQRRREVARMTATQSAANQQQAAREAIPKGDPGRVHLRPEEAIRRSSPGRNPRPAAVCRSHKRGS